jgi:hypothetical protein
MKSPHRSAPKVEPLEVRRLLAATDVPAVAATLMRLHDELLAFLDSVKAEAGR